MLRVFVRLINASITIFHDIVKVRRPTNTNLIMHKFSYVLPGFRFKALFALNLLLHFY